MGLLKFFVETKENPVSVVEKKPPPKYPSSSGTSTKSPNSVNGVFSASDNTYEKFKATVDAMSSIPNEGTRYIAAFAGLSVGGVNKAQLISSLQTQIQSVSQEKNDFDAQFKSFYHEQVEIKKDELAEKSRQLADLSAAIESLNKDIKSSDEDLKEKQQKFLSENHSKGEELEAQLDKINQYIQ